MSAAGWAGSGPPLSRGPARRPRIDSDQCKAGGGSGGGGGSSVDPMALANAQGQANVGSAESQAQLNNVSTFSPYGSTQYQPNQYDPATGKASGYNVNQVLSPQLQQLFSTQTGLAQAVAGAGSPFAAAAPAMATTGSDILSQVGNLAASLPRNIDLSAVPNIGMLSPSSFRTDVTGGAGGQAIPGAVTSVNSNFPQLVKQAQDAAYQQQTQYLDPQFNQQEESLHQSLADQGIEAGSPAYSRAMGDFNRQKQMAYGNAQDQAVQAGNEQQRALFTQALAGGQFTNQAQAQLFGQGMSLADLYNQSVLGAQGANVTAAASNLGRAQAGFQAPYSAATGLTGIGTNIYGTGLGSLAGVLPGVTAWPTGAANIPNLASGTATGVSPTNVVGAQDAATKAGTLGLVQSQTNLKNLLGFGALGNQFLGNPLGSLGNLFSGGGGAPSFIPGSDIPWSAAPAAGGGGGLLGGLGDWLGNVFSTLGPAAAVAAG